MGNTDEADTSVDVPRLHDTAAEESPPAQRVAVMVAAAAIALALMVHIGAIFLHVAPRNALSAEHGKSISVYLGPEFRQTWKLFAPSVPQTTTHVYARAEIQAADGTRATDWVDVTRTDLEELRGAPLPSRARGELRETWSDVLGSHRADGTPASPRGLDAERHLMRIVLPRLAEVGRVERIQFKQIVKPVPNPPWQQPAASGSPSAREFPWWPVTAADWPEGA